MCELSDWQTSVASEDKLGLIETKGGTQKVYHPVSILYI